MSTEKPVLAQQCQETAEHQQQGAASGCPVCKSGLRSHAFVVTDENGEWQIRHRSFGCR
jgi:hypothetical protein